MTKEYKDKFAISQSAIKDWESMSPKKWNETWILKSRPRPQAGASATFGSVLDCLVFTPKNFDKRFVVAEVQLPSENIRNVVNHVYTRIKELNKNAEAVNANLKKGQPPVALKELKLDYEDLIIAHAKEIGYYATQPNRAYNEVMKSGPEYFEHIKKTEGKTTITAADKSEAEKLRDILFTDKMVKGFFVKAKHTDFRFQEHIFANIDISGFENVDFLPLKGAVDEIYFNHKTKQVREIDLKWTNDAFMFKDAAKRFGYAKQHSFYDYLIREWLKTYRDGEFKDYTVGNPLNVVIDSDEKVPYIYQYNANDLYIERYGHENMHWFKGWEQTLYEIAWHMNEQQWDRPKEHLQNGSMNIQFFKR